MHILKALPVLIISGCAFGISNEAVAETSPSGLIYQSLKEGSGVSPRATDVVRVHYIGTFPDSGKEFDSSYKSHGSDGIEFSLNQVIACWTEGVQKMKPGGKAKLTCPPSIAYGASGAGSLIPPNATLNFEVELISVKSKGGSAVTDRKQALTQANQSNRPVRSPNLEALLQKTLGARQ
jgi:FKBP-type peptidyl-prolyl cis-trans isomerase FkpA